MTAMNEPDIVLDCRGQLCPQPIIELARRIADVPPGGLIAVVADDPAAAADVPAWCRLRSHTYEGNGDGMDGVPSYIVRRAS